MIEVTAGSTYVTLNIISIDPSTWMTESMAMERGDPDVGVVAVALLGPGVYSDLPAIHRRDRPGGRHNRDIPIYLRL